MPQIELWEKLGVMKVVSKMNRPVELVALEDSNGDIFPIYEGNNEVPAGSYNIVVLRPYATGNEPVMQRRDYVKVEVWNDNDVAFIVNERGFTGMGYMPYKADRWEEYACKYNDKLVRPVGWNYGSAIKMIAEVKKRI